MSFNIGDAMLLSTRNLSLKGSHHLCDHYCGHFVVTEHIGETAHRVDLQGKGLDGIHDVFHVSLLHPYLSNGLSTEVPPVELDGELEYEIATIKGHRISHGELYSWFHLLGMMLLRTCGCLYLSYHMLRSCCQLITGSMGFDGLDTTWGALDLTLSDIFAMQGAQSALGLMGLITPLWLSVF